jgi:hypothetical protein
MATASWATSYSAFFWPAALIVAYLVEDRTTVVEDCPAPTAT